MDKVAIILVNYNGKDYLEDCIKSINNIEYENYEIIVVDNKSTDNSIEHLRNLDYKITIIEAEKNGGFSYGNNIGIKYALENSFEYFLLLNNDTIVKEDFLSEMMKSFKNNKNVGAVGAKIMYYPDIERIWFGGGEINWKRFKVIHNYIKEVDVGQCNIEKEISFMTGCVLLISKTTIENIGLLDEEYFMYCEDLDYSLKILEKKFKIIFNPKAIIYHKVSLSSGGEDSPFTLYWKTKNTLKVMEKYKNRTTVFSYNMGKLLFYIENIIKAVKYKLSGCTENYEALKKALLKE